MKINKITGKRIAVSCAAVCLTGALLWNGTGVTAWAAPTTGSALSDNTRVRSSIGGNPIGSLKANQEVKIKSEKTSEDGYTWYEITFDWNGEQTDGWVRSDMISSGSGSGSEDTDTADQTDSNSNKKKNTTSNDSGTDQESDQTEAQDSAFVIDGKTYEIADRFPTSEIPEGFQETTITYADTEVPAAKMDAADVVLLYLQNTEDTEDKNVFLLDSERNQAVPFVSVATEDGFIVVTDVPTDIEAAVSDYYHKTTCGFAEGGLMAYQNPEAGDTVDANASVSDFYYVYGVSSDGSSGWYVYDAAAQTLQRSVANMQYEQSQDQAGDGDSQDASVFEPDSMTRMLMAGLGVIALLLLILFIVASVRYRRLRKYLDNNEDLAEDEFFDDATTFGLEIAGNTVDVVDFDGKPDQNSKKKKKSRKLKKEEKPVSNQVEDTENVEAEKKAEDADTAEIENRVEEAELSQKKKEKELNPETEKLVADLKKMIQEVETTLHPNEDDDTFLEDDDSENEE